MFEGPKVGRTNLLTRFDDVVPNPNPELSIRRWCDAAHVT